MSERATIRPVTLGRLVELIHLCAGHSTETADVETQLGVSHRRARETALEAARIGLVTIEDGENTSVYRTSEDGETLLEHVRNERWARASSFLRDGSPHYRLFLETVETLEPTAPEAVLERLERHDGPHEFNETSLDVLGDWSERLGAVQRNAFTGTYYRVESDGTDDASFPETLQTVFDELEETTGVNLSQRYLSVPRLREFTCERLRWPRARFDETLLELSRQNVGRLELSGAPVDTGAKDATLGIKTIELADNDGLVSTTQSTDRVMAGVEQHGKQYYYLAIHDENLSYDSNT